MRLMNQQTELWGSTWFFSDTRSGMWRPGPTLSGDTSQPIITKCRESKIGHASMVGGFNHEIYFPWYIGNNDPNWRTHIFQRSGSTTNQLCMFMESLFAVQQILLKMTPLTVVFFFRIRGSSRNQSDHIQKNTGDWLHPLDPSGKLSHNYGKSPFSMGKYGTSTISMAIFNSYFDITRGYIHIYCLMSRLP